MLITVNLTTHNPQRTDFEIHDLDVPPFDGTSNEFFEKTQGDHYC